MRIFGEKSSQSWLQAYLEYTKTLEAPELFHFWAGVATLAGALQGKVYFDMGYFQWRPNFFIIFVAPPGVANKSTTMGVGMNLLRDVENIKFGPDSATWQAVTDSFIDAKQSYIMPDGTEFQTSSITISVSELGTFLDPRNREMVDVLVDLWDGRAVPWVRKTRGEGEQKIRNPWLNFIGCTTPSWITENFPEYAIGGGFTSRTVFVYGETKRHLTAYPLDLIKDDFEALRAALTEDLKSVAKLCGPFSLTPEAKQWGVSWYENLWMKREDHLEDARYAGYIARKQTHIHKLAMVLSAAESDSREIHLHHIQKANEYVTYTEHDMPKVFNQIGSDSNTRAQVLLLSILKKRNRPIPKETLWRTLFTHMTYETFTKALQALLSAGWVSYTQTGNTVLIVPHIPQDTDSQTNPRKAPS